MINILCFGDSNTFGCNTFGGPRYGTDVRWPCVLQKLLGDEFKVYENGLDGRTTVYDDPTVKYRNGMESVPYAYRTTYPLDIIVIMLGSNDTKFVSMGDYALNARNIAYGAEMVIKEFKAEAFRFGQKEPAFILVSPPLIGYKSSFIRFTKEGSETSRFFAEKFRIAAKNQKATFLDAAPLCETGPDCLHIIPDSHARLAAAVAETIKAVISNS